MADGKGTDEEGRDKGAETEELTWLGASARARDLMARESLPNSKPPTNLLGADYDFPTDPGELTSFQLGKIRLQLSALRGHTERLLGERDIFLSELETVFEYMVGVEMFNVAKSDRTAGMPRGAIVKDVLRHLAIDGDDQLKKLFHRMIDVRAEVKTFQLQFNIYEGHLQALSREQSRRESETKFG